MKTYAISLLLLSTFSLTAWSQKLPLDTESAKDLVAALKALPKKEAQTIIEELLEEHSSGQHYDKDQLKLLAPFLGVNLLSSLDTLTEEKRTAVINEALDSYTRLPLKLVLTLKERSKGMDLVAGSITAHPKLAIFKNTRPRGWASGTFSDVPGVGAIAAHPSIIAADSLHKGHGSINLILHEVGHAVDRYFKNKDEAMDYSGAKGFKELNTLTPFARLWDATGAAYQKQNSEECFAELFAMYFHDANSRDKLTREFPKASEYFNKNFGE